MHTIVSGYEEFAVAKRRFEQIPVPVPKVAENLSLLPHRLRQARRLPVATLEPEIPCLLAEHQIKRARGPAMLPRLQA